MIGYIEGTVIANDDRGIVILTRSGVGYLLLTPRASRESSGLDTEAAFWVHTVVREDALDLYGFASEQELRFFKLLTSVSGVGPKTALGALGSADATSLIHAIRGGDSAYLTKLGGIGKKTAEKIIIELRDKCEDFAIEAMASGAMSNEAVAGSMRETEALEVLEAMGYDPRKAKDLIRTLAREHESVQDVIRAALKQLS